MYKKNYINSVVASSIYANYVSYWHYSQKIRIESMPNSPLKTKCTCDLEYNGLQKNTNVHQCILL